MAKMIITKKKLGDLYEAKREKTTSESPVTVYLELAYCFKQLNKKTRDPNFIIKAEYWTPVDGDGDKIHRFKFHVRYDENNEYLYVYEFIKCRF